MLSQDVSHGENMLWPGTDFSRITVKTTYFAERSLPSTCFLSPPTWKCDHAISVFSVEQ